MRVAVAGAGYFARFHLDAWLRMADVSLIGLADRNPEARVAWDLPGFDDLDSLLGQVTPDVLDIALPPAAHLDAIKRAIAAGVPTIICQKPFCGGLGGAQEALELIKGTGTRIIVHENFRFQPWFVAAGEAIAAGRVGDVHQMTFRLRSGDGQGPRAYLDRQPYFQQMDRLLIHETGVHLLDVFQSLFGPAEAVYADLRQINPVIAGEDAGFVTLDYARGVRCLFDGNRHLDHDAENCRLTLGEAWIEGTEGTLYVTGDGAVALRRFGATEREAVLEPQDWPGFGGDCVYAFQRHAIDAIRSGTSAATEANAYIEVLKLQEAAYLSSEQGRKIQL